MKIKSFQYAYGEGEEREIDIPDVEWEKMDVAGRLEAAFYYGQNDFQPVKDRYSVSVGDVIDLGPDGLHLVCGIGFKAIPAEEFEAWKAKPRRERLDKASSLYMGI